MNQNSASSTRLNFGSMQQRIRREGAEEKGSTMRELPSTVLEIHRQGRVLTLLPHLQPRVGLRMVLMLTCKNV